MSSSKRSRTNKHDKCKKSYAKPRSSNNQFVSSHAQFKYTMLCKKQVIFGRSVVISDFRHLNLASILENNSLQYFILIKEKVYPNVVILCPIYLLRIMWFTLGLVTMRLTCPWKYLLAFSTSLLRVLTYMTMILESF